MDKQANSSKMQTADEMRDREIRLIHVAKRELQLDDATYRAMLWAIARVKSSSDLDFSGRKRVLDHLKSRGFKVKSVPANKNNGDARYRKIRALWSELKKRELVQQDTDKAVRAYTKRITNFDDFQFLNDHQISMVIESLKKWLDRVDSNRDAVLSNTREKAHV